MADPRPPREDYQFLADQLAGLRREIASGQEADGQQLAQSLKKLREQVAAQATVIETLTAIADSKYAEFTTHVGGFVGWADSVSVALTSPTGRIEIHWGGALNGGEGYFCYSVRGDRSGTIVSRESLLQNPARRVAVTGGASFAPSGSAAAIVDVPRGESLTVQLHLCSSLSFTTFFGGWVLARVAP
ncbi:hypothetical protein [Lysinibacter sp. HNR]|uniref:hypothetical protein n=1 Tax=Lysinibacter sp. HNR TaxID=3031408 RepID=UPI0024352DE4|nr:hypothetical protein [Lysinibacter sp. HNR]WGD36831.1 hypothetical protein FrondiHNR_10270 [Lysinibacter sp. HNR]